MRFVLVAIASGMLGAALGQPPSPPPAPLESQGVYQLSSGDSIELKFHYNPELNLELTIRPDGKISTALVGEVQAAGLNPAELSTRLSAEHSKFLRNPQVTVVVKTFSGQKVFVGGEVMGPRAVEVRGSLTCLQAILSAGGPRSSGRLSEVILVRYQGEGKAEVRRIDLNKVMKGTAPDTVLQAYDVVMIPRRRVSKVSQFVDEYINQMVPKSLFFPYNLNNTISYNVR